MMPSSRFFIAEPKPDPIYRMLGKHERLFEECDIEELSRLPKGWHPVIVDLADVVHDYLKETKIPGFRFLNVKEINGELFIDQQCDDEGISNMIGITKEICKNTCQLCGELGEEFKQKNKKFVLCEKHQIEKEIVCDDED